MVLRKKIIAIIIANLIVKPVLCQLNPYEYPYPQDSIVLLKGAPDRATMPFDKPFYLIINPSAYGFDISQVVGIFAYKTIHAKNKRTLRNSSPDITFKLKSTYDTIGGRLVINFPALKPNSDFDISIHTKLSPGQRVNLLEVVNSHGTAAATNAWSEIKNALTIQKDYYANPRTSIKYTGENDYYNKKNATLTPLINQINSASFQNISFGTDAQIKAMFVAADAAKIQNDVLYLLDAKGITINDIEKGLVPLSNFPGKKAESLDVITRTKNIGYSIMVFTQIRNILWQIYLKSNDATVNTLLSMTQTNIDNLTTNQDKLKNFSDQVILNTDDNGGTYQATWLIGSDKNFNLSTKGGSLLSTEVGIANLRIKNNSNKVQSIPKIFTGVNIFFRPVDRNLPTRHMRATSNSDHLSSKESIFQHLSLSLGLTFGDFDQTDANKKDFQNLFSNMSLLIGPSYRFHRAFRLSAGTSILKRLNPNPLITGSTPTIGFYGPFSIDFDFISTISSVTGRILK